MKRSCQLRFLCAGLILMAIGMAGLGYAAQRVIVATARKAEHEALLERASMARECLEEGMEEPGVGKAALGSQMRETAPQGKLSADTMDAQIAMVKAVEVGAPGLKMCLAVYQRGITPQGIAGHCLPALCVSGMAALAQGRL